MDAKLAAMSVSDRFREIDKVFVEELGTKTVEQVMTDLENEKLSIKAVADRSNIRMMDVVQIARYYKIDPVTLEPTR